MKSFKYAALAGMMALVLSAAAVRAEPKTNLLSQWDNGSDAAANQGGPQLADNSLNLW